MNFLRFLQASAIKKDFWEFPTNRKAAHGRVHERVATRGIPMRPQRIRARAAAAAMAGLPLAVAASAGMQTRAARGARRGPSGAARRALARREVGSASHRPEHGRRRGSETADVRRRGELGRKGEGEGKDARKLHLAHGNTGMWSPEMEEVRRGGLDGGRPASSSKNWNYGLGTAREELGFGEKLEETEAELFTTLSRRGVKEEKPATELGCARPWRSLRERKKRRQRKGTEENRSVGLIADRGEVLTRACGRSDGARPVGRATRPSLPARHEEGARSRCRRG